MSSMTDLEAGQLVADVRALREDVAALTIEMKSLQLQAAYGKGVLFGMLSIAGGVGAGIAWVVGKVF
jgi:hypothetical protein